MSQRTSNTCPQSDIERAARDTLRLIEAAGYARPFLLVYDNVDRPADIGDWTPRSGAHILLTTRKAGSPREISSKTSEIKTRESKKGCSVSGRTTSKKQRASAIHFFDGGNKGRCPRVLAV
jgi:hypothetical protein